jgi:hypothetical protein
MRVLWLMPFIASACTPLPPTYSAMTPIRQYQAADSKNCGTPDEYKACGSANKSHGITWKPPARIPVYAEQLTQLPGNIPLSDMPNTIAITGGANPAGIDDRP